MTKKDLEKKHNQKYYILWVQMKKDEPLFKMVEYLVKITGKTKTSILKDALIYYKVFIEKSLGEFEK